MMMIGSIELDNDLVWEDEFKFTQGTGVAENTIYGSLVVQTFRVSGYRPLTLSGSNNSGWQSRATVLALQALASDNPSAEHAVLLPNGTTVTAMFRHEEAPVVEFQPIALATEPAADFWYYGTIKMRIVA